MSRGEDALEDAAAATVAVVNVVAVAASTALASLRPPGNAASTTQN